MAAALVWFRRDLRLTDNPALQAALDSGHTPIPLYIHAPSAPSCPGAAGAWWLHHSLAALRHQLRQLGSDLLILEGDAATRLMGCARALNIRTVFWNRRYDPHGIAEDRCIATKMQSADIQAKSFNASLLREPREIVKADGRPYRVFTPFWKTLQKAGLTCPPLPAPPRLPPPAAGAADGVSLDSLGLLPEIAWDRDFHHHWRPGEAGAHAALERLCADALLDYGSDRDRPDRPGTSRLSPHLHFGEISPCQLWRQLHQWATGETTPGAVAAAEGFLRQVGWREFGHHLLFHFPQTVSQPLDPRFAGFPWRGDYLQPLHAWQRGQTGIPVVDAGMRELWATGWMHNRVRMLVASLLTKNLLIPWQEGAHWFMDTLVDADLANNTLGWQWTAGCGADAAPYFRIFNPVRQGERFDPEGSYVRRWVPELAQLPGKWIHRPWEAPASVMQDAGVKAGVDYPLPIVDLLETRRRALEAWDRIKRQKS